MPRYRLTIAYDGTDFCGWQKQEPIARSEGAQAAYAEQTPLMDSTRDGRVALRTVQGIVEQAVREVVREPIELIGASRTDSGVHAKGQVAAFSCEPREEELVSGAVAKPEGAESSEGTEAGRHPGIEAKKGTGWPLARGCDRLMAAINSRLPEDVLVIAAEAVPHGFDSVSDCTSKGYSYTFHVSRTRPLWDRRVVHHIWNPSGLDAEAMHAAAAILVGEHDFAAFAAAGHGRLSTVRRVISCEVKRESAERVRMEISGTGFLWNMVRIIAGTLLQVGLGQREAAEVRGVLEGRDRQRAGPTLPATGLCLEWIRYR